MKTFKILMVGILLLTTIQSNATTTFDKDDLIKKMVNDENVLALLKNNTKIVLINAVNKNDLSELPAETLDAYSNLLITTGQNKKNVEAKFPEYAKMEVSEKEEILKRITGESIVYRNFMSCVFQKITLMVTCTGMAVGSWQAVRFYFCSGVVATADVAAAAATAGTAGAAVLTAALAEIGACLAITGVAINVIRKCLDRLTNDLLEC